MKFYCIYIVKNGENRNGFGGCSPRKQIVLSLVGDDISSAVPGLCAQGRMTSSVLCTSSINALQSGKSNDLF